MSMIDLYEIGVSFIIQRDVFTDVETLQDGMNVLQEAIDKVNASLARTSDLISAATGSAAGMASAFERAASAAERAATAHENSAGGGGGASDAPAQPMALIPVDGGGGGGEPPAPTGGGDPGGQHYLPPPDNYPPPPPPNNPPNSPQHQVNPWDYIIAGGAVYEGGKHAITYAYDSAADVQHQGVLMQNQGANKGDVASATSAAQALQQRFPGLTQEQGMTIIRDAYMQTRNMPEAIGMANTLAESAYVLQSYGDTDAAEAIFSASRAGELRGLLNDKNPDGSVNLNPLQGFIDAFTKASESTGGRVSPQDALTILKNAGPEGLMMDQDAMTEALVLSTTLGSPGVGTGLNALAIQFLGGKMSQGAAQNLHRAGLLPDYMFDHDTGKILNKYKNGLGQILMPNGALKDEAEFQKNPFDWIENTFDPAVSKLDPTSQTALLNSIYADASRIPGGRLMAETIFQNGYIQRQLGFLDDVPGMNQSLDNLKNDPKNVSGGLVAAFQAFMAQIGGDGMATATAQLKALTGGLNDLTDWAKKNPSAGQDVFRGGEAVTAGGAGLALYGIYRAVQKALGFGGKSGAGEDAAFGEAEGAAGDGAVPLGNITGGATVGEITGGPVGALAAGVLFLLTKNLQAAMTKNGLDPSMLTGEYAQTGQPIPVTLVPSPGAPSMPVHVTNPGDIANGSIGALAAHQGLMPTGPNGINPALAPHLPGTDAPGAAQP